MHLLIRVERVGEQEQYRTLTSPLTDPSGASVEILAEVRVDLGDARTALDLLHASAERLDARLDVEDVSRRLADETTKRPGYDRPPHARASASTS